MMSFSMRHHRPVLRVTRKGTHDRDFSAYAWLASTNAKLPKPEKRKLKKCTKSSIGKVLFCVALSYPGVEFRQLVVSWGPILWGYRSRTELKV